MPEAISVDRAADPVDILQRVRLPRLHEQWHGIAEGAVMLAVLLAVDAVVTGGARFEGIQPSPFGLVVLLVSAQYGLGQGAFVALLAIAARYGGHLPQQGFGQDSIVYLRQVATDPMLWLACALVVGSIASRLRARVAAAERTALHARQELSVTVTAASRLSASLAVLEGKVAGQLRTASSIYEAARDLGPDMPDVLSNAPALLRAATECTRCSIYLLKGDSLHLAASEGRRADDGLAERIGPGPLFEAVVGRRATLVASRTADAEVLARQGILAAPIIAPGNGAVPGAVLGMLKVEEIGFARLHLDTVANFQAVCAWVGTALMHAEAFVQARDERFTVGGGRLVSAHHSERMIDYLTGLAARLGFDLSLLTVEVGGREAAGQHDDAAGTGWVRQLLEDSFRDTDMMLEVLLDQRRFSVLLPGTDHIGAEIAADRLRVAFELGNTQEIGVVTVRSVTLHDGRSGLEDAA